MTKTGVVDGNVKTASADTAEEAVGADARCIAAAMGGVSGVAGAVAGARSSLPRGDEGGDEGEGARTDGR